MKNKTYKFFLLAPMLIGFLPIDGLKHFKSDSSFILAVKSTHPETSTPLYAITMGELVRLKDETKQFEDIVKDTIVVTYGFKEKIREATSQHTLLIDGEVEKYLGYGENQHVPYFNVTSWKTDKYVPLNRKWTKTDWILYSFLFMFGIALITYILFLKTKSIDKAPE